MYRTARGLAPVRAIPARFSKGQITVKTSSSSTLAAGVTPEECPPADRYLARRRPGRSAFANGAPTTRDAASTHRQTILVADDDPILLSSVALLLRSAGYGCIRARNGEQALRRIVDERLDVDLLLLDVFMPGLDGFTAWRQINRHRPNIPCIIMSAAFDSELALRLRPDDVLQKPFEPAALLVSVRNALAAPTP